MATLPPLPPGAVLDNPELPPLPPGVKLDVPESTMLSDAINYGPGFVKETAKVAARGAGKAWAGMGDLMKGAANGLNNPFMQIIMNQLDPKGAVKQLDKDIPDELGDGAYKKIVETAGGVAALPVPGVSAGRQGLAALAAGEGAAGGRKAAELIAPSSPGVADWAELIGSAAGGMFGGFALGPRQSIAKQDVRQVLQGQDFPAAQANADAARRSGSTTATAAEMFPVGSAPMRLAESARSATPVNPLAAATENRPGDIKALADTFLNRIGPEVNPNTIATQAASSADSFFKNLKQNRGADTRAPMAGVDLPAAEVQGLSQGIGQLAGWQQRKPAQDAYTAVAEAISPNASQLNPHGVPITSLQELSFAVKDLKKAAKNPNSPVSTGQISANDYRQAISQVEDYLYVRQPGYKEAMDNFGAHTEKLLKPAGQSPIGKLSNRNPILAGEQSVSKLEGLLRGNNAQMVEDTVSDLARPKLTGGNTTSPTDIARALAQTKLNAGPLDPGQAIRGTEGSGQQANFEALLRAGGNNVENTMEPLAVADRLQPFLKSASSNLQPKMSLFQMIRPFRTIDMATSANRTNKANAEVARLLADNSPEAIRRLQEISMFDPNIRRMLMLKSAIPPAGEE
jgi:hypothetical protein